jgi:thioredoxin 1
LDLKIKQNGGNNMQNVSSSDFKAEVADSKIPVVVDCWAEWCGPCRAIAPAFEALGKELEGKVKFVKMDIDANQEFASEYRIMSIPTFLVFKDGKEALRKIGMFSKDNFKTELTSLL